MSTKTCTGCGQTKDESLFCRGYRCKNCHAESVSLSYYKRKPGGVPMGVRENKVERHLDCQVTELGGITRKWVSPGVDGVPDRIVFYKSQVFVEVKTVDGDLSEEQVREHKRLRKQGAQVTTVYGNIGVDRFMNDLHLITPGWNFEHEYR